MALAEFAPDGRLVFANARFLALLDLGPEHQGNLEHARLCPPELVRSPDYAAMWRSLCTGHEFSGVVERVRGDGGRCWLEALYAPVRDHEGKVSRILVVATNVGHSKRTELARQDHLWRLSLVADYTDAAIVITDARSRVVYSNDGFQRMFGWTLGEIQGQKMLELLVPQIATGRAEERCAPACARDFPGTSRPWSPARKAGATGARSSATQSWMPRGNGPAPCRCCWTSPRPRSTRSCTTAPCRPCRRICR